MIVLSESLQQDGAPQRDPLAIPRDLVHNSSMHFTFNKFWERYGKFAKHLMKVSSEKSCQTNFTLGVTVLRSQCVFSPEKTDTSAHPTSKRGERSGLAVNSQLDPPIVALNFVASSIHSFKSFLHLKPRLYLTLTW